MRTAKYKLPLLVKHISEQLTAKRDLQWLLIWICGIILLWIWDILYLNLPALKQIQSAFLNTLFISFLVLLFSFILGWLTTITLYFIEKIKLTPAVKLISYLLNLIRSVPQIIGVLLSFVILTNLKQHALIHDNVTVMLLMALSISLFIFLEVYDLLSSRIDYFKKSDFFNAMLVCGIGEFRIINSDVLWKNSINHMINKAIAIFASAIFILCSVDFILSVGLSTEVSSVNFPGTLGSLLAKIDSKQDILAIGHTIGNPLYITRLLIEHLQGITIAFLIVFTLLSLYKMSDHYALRKEL